MSKVWVFVLLLVLAAGGFFVSKKSQLTSPSPNVQVSPTVAKNDCVKAGCSGQLCLESAMAKDIVTTCEWKEEYGCYKDAVCERQSNGECGFTKTPELQSCLKK